MHAVFSARWHLENGVLVIYSSVDQKWWILGLINWDNETPLLFCTNYTKPTVHCEQCFVSVSAVHICACDV